MATSIFAGPNRSKALVEFRAGKMTVRGKLVSPDTRKGMISLEMEDNLLHFKWKDRTTGTVEIDKIVFADEVVFKRVKQCTTARVYLLEYTNQSRLFFWMQEPSEDKDEEYCKQINDYIKNPPSPSNTDPGLGLDQNQLYRMMQGLPARGGTSGQTTRRGDRTSSASASTSSSASGSASTTSSSGTSTSSSTTSSPSSSSSSSSTSSTGISQDFLQNVLSGIVGGDQTSSQQERESDEPSLQTLLDPENIAPLLQDPEVQQQLLQHLPEGNRSVSELQQLVHTPQFQQAVGILNAAIQSGQLDALLPHFGLSGANVSNSGGLSALAQALAQHAQQRQNNNTSTTSTSSTSNTKEGEKKDSEEKKETTEEKKETTEEKKDEKDEKMDVDKTKEEKKD